MKGPLLIPLTCGLCGGDLDGGPNALIYLCRGCAVARFAPRMEISYPLRFVRPRADFCGRVAAYAPFWRISGKATAICEETDKMRAIHNLRPLGPLFFPAFWSLKAYYCDNLTLRYAALHDEPEFEERGDAVLDGVRDPAVLPAMARLTWLAYVDRAIDVTGVELTFEQEDLLYAAVPFVAAGDYYLDGLLGIQVPGSLFSGGSLGIIR